MRYNKDTLIKLFLETVDVSVSELDRARKALKRAHRIINIKELEQINRFRMKNNQKRLDFNIHFDNNGKIVVDDNDIYYETTESLIANPKYKVNTIYSLFEDGIYVKKMLFKAINEQLCYKTFFNNHVLEESLAFESPVRTLRK